MMIQQAGSALIFLSFRIHQVRSLASQLLQWRVVEFSRTIDAQNALLDNVGEVSKCKFGFGVGNMSPGNNAAAAFNRGTLTDHAKAK